MIDFDKAVDEMIDRAHHRKEMEIIREKAAEGKLIIIFGAGNCGHAVYRFLVEEGLAVEAFCDNRLAGGIDTDTNVRIIGVEEMEDDKDRYFILISLADRPVYQEVHAQLMELGFEDKQCLYMENYIERIPVDFLIGNREKYRKVFELLAGDISKEIYIERMNRVF